MTTDRPICRIGTRGSDLALWQARHIAGLLAARDVDTEIVIIKTKGDRIDDVPFAKLEGKGFFTKELEDAQLAGRVDLAVHSLKDLATEMPAELVLTALVGREDPREMLLASPAAVDPERQAAGEVLPLRSGVRVGTSAARRQAQVHALRPDLEIGDLRGNVPTRVQRLREGRHDAILLAAAGLARLDLDLSDLFTVPLAPEDFVPAPAQGMLGIQCAAASPWREHLQRLHTADAAAAVQAERELLTRLEGGCQVPFGVHVARGDDAWRLDVFLARSPQDDQPLRFFAGGPELDTLVDSAWNRITAFRESEA